MPADEHEHEDERAHRDDRDPGASAELRRRDDYGDSSGGYSAWAVDDETSSPAGLSQPPPMPDHARLRERERDEDADRIQRDEIGHVAAEHNQEQCRGASQQHDAVRKSEAVALERELARHELVLRQDGGQAREV